MECSIHNIDFSSEKVIWSESGEKYRIHCWASDAMLHFSRSDAERQLSTSWVVWGWRHFQQIHFWMSYLFNKPCIYWFLMMSVQCSGIKLLIRITWQIVCDGVCVCVCGGGVWGCVSVCGGVCLCEGGVCLCEGGVCLCEGGVCLCACVCVCVVVCVRVCGGVCACVWWCVCMCVWWCVCVCVWWCVSVCVRAQWYI